MKLLALGVERWYPDSQMIFHKRRYRQLAASFGVATPAGIRIVGKFSQQDLGNLVAASRESVNKQLRAWQEAGLLKIEHGALSAPSRFPDMVLAKKFCPCEVVHRTPRINLRK